MSVKLTPEAKAQPQDLIVKIYSNSMSRDEAGKITTAFIDAQVDCRNDSVRESVETGAQTPTGKAQTKRLLNQRSLSLTTTGSTRNGVRTLTNNAPYTKAEMDAILASARESGNYFERKLEKPDGTPRVDKAGRQVVEVIAGVRANVVDVPVTTRKGEPVLNKDKSPRTRQAIDVSTLEPHSKGITADAMKYQIEAVKERVAHDEKQAKEAPAASAPIQSHEAAAPAAEAPEVSQEAAFG